MPFFGVVILFRWILTELCTRHVAFRRKSWSYCVVHTQSKLPG